MTDRGFRASIVMIAIAFVAYFGVVVVPPLLSSGDIMGAFAAGFVNPYSSGYSADVIACWMVLAVWVTYESRAHAIRGGWICLLLGVAPGVVVGFATYLIVRSRQFSEEELQARPPDAA